MDPFGDARNADGGCKFVMATDIDDGMTAADRPALWHA